MVAAGAGQDAVLLSERITPGGMKLAIATLNAPKSLNALSFDMIRMLDTALRRWANNPQIACVVLNGAGDKAFCAGGDVRSLREVILGFNGPPPNPLAEAFFGAEYRLDYYIHRYPKPVLVWGDGVVMGGGLGLMAGASHRVVTERSRIAMPEITIGLYPDVGASWFLRRMPGRSGLFLALTGAQINASDALYVGLADMLLKADDREALVDHLTQLSWNSLAADNRVLLSRALRSWAMRTGAALPSSHVRSNEDTIQHLTDADTLVEIWNRITGYRGDDAWLQRAASTLQRGSPTTAALIWEIWERAKHYSLAEVFQMELIVSVQCCVHPDLPEGVRALLIDKDNTPHWTPATLQAVSPAWVAEHFRDPWSGRSRHPLSDLQGG